MKQMEDLPAGVKQEIGPLLADRWAELKELAKMCTASGQEGVQSQQQQQQQQQQPPQKQEVQPSKRQRVKATVVIE